LFARLSRVFRPKPTPGTPLDRRGPPCTSICTKNQPRRPILRPGGDERKIPPDCLQAPSPSHGIHCMHNASLSLGYAKFLCGSMALTVLQTQLICISNRSMLPSNPRIRNLESSLTFRRRGVTQYKFVLLNRSLKSRRYAPHRVVHRGLVKFGRYALHRATHKSQ